MENIQIKHFSGLLTDWESKVAQGDFNNDIVFAKAWKQDASTQQWVQKLIIYAGKDNLNQEYSYDIADFSTFVAVTRLIDISNGGFTSQAFRNSLENYLVESEKMLAVDSSLNELDERINEVTDALADINASVNELAGDINSINTSLGIIDASLSAIDASIQVIEKSIDWDEEG